MVTVVTGAAGMLGSAVVSRLTGDGDEVVGVDLRSVPDQPGYRHVTGDVRDPVVLRTLRDAGAIVHCAAALPSYPVEQIRSITVDGTRAVFAAARAAGVPRIVHISSTAVYGLPTQVPTPEEHPYAPVDPYSRAKVEAERIATGHRGDGMVVAVLRPKTFLGPGRMGLFSMLFQWAEEGRNFPVLGDGGVRIQMLHVADLVDAVTVALRAPADVAGDTYNIAAAEFGTLREDFQAVLDAAGHGKRVIGLPARPARAALGLLERTRLSPVYGRLLHKLMADSYVDISKARNQLGFAPRYANRDAILQTYAWWRTERRKGQETSGHLPNEVGAVATNDGERPPIPIRVPSLHRTSGDPWRQGVLAVAKVFF